MSLSQNKTLELWQAFVPAWKSRPDLARPECYSVEVYPEDYFKGFDPSKPFEKWAAIEITEQKEIPNTWEVIEVPEGLYAVFSYKGKSSEVHQLYQYIFTTWIPDSDYFLDNRPHFAVMGEKYRNDDPDSEEEIWIPIQRK